MEMPKHCNNLISAWLLCSLTLSIISESFSARILASPISSNSNHAYHVLSFQIPDMFSSKQHPTRPPTTSKMNGHHLPFSKQSGFLPPRDGIPLTETDPTGSMTSISSQTLDLKGISLPFPAIATLQELELGTVTAIDEEIYGETKSGSQFVGRAHGLCVVSSEDGSSHMMAVTASFAGSQNKDELRFFGVLRSDVVESHIAVIGGAGKYQNANGYATVKNLNESSSTVKVLAFTVYLG